MWVLPLDMQLVMVTVEQAKVSWSSLDDSDVENEKSTLYNHAIVRIT